MDGPLTLGIFSPEGKLIRLLYQNASIETVPAGLNGLLISWDGKDDSGIQVPAGTYHARGLIHGAIAVSMLPQMEQGLDSLFLQELPGDDLLQDALPLMPKGTITVKAAQDALYENPPLLAITAQLRSNEIILAADGLPLLSIPLGKRNMKPLVKLSHGEEAGIAKITLILPQGREIYTVSGLDRLVPLDAGSLEMPSDTFLSSHESVRAGESQQ